jgi:hypothetical protein
MVRCGFETYSTYHKKICCREGHKEMARHFCFGFTLLCTFDGAKVEHMDDGDRESNKPCKEYDEKNADAANNPSDDDDELADRFKDS